MASISDAELEVRTAEPIDDSTSSGDRFSAALSWLSSLVVHMTLMILLGLWMLAPEVVPHPVSLIAASGDGDDEGVSAEIEEVAPQMQVDAVGDRKPADLAEEDPFSTDESLSVALEGVEQLKVELIAPEASLAAGEGSIFSGRDPRQRALLVEKGGGSRYSEEAVARGLRWLADHQNADGSWSLDRFQNSPRCKGRCQGQGNPSDTAATALGLLPFLGAGQTHLSGPYATVIGSGLNWLIGHQASDGDLRGEGSGRMYAHGQAALALCEAYALTQDRKLRDPAQKALDFIIRAQHSEGGWRYDPGQAGDTSVVGWQIMALRSGQLAYLNVSKHTLSMADKFLNSTQALPVPSLSSYLPGGPATRTMTAEALLCRQYMGWKHEHPGLQGGIVYLLQALPDTQEPAMYYWYYATQVMHHFGGEAWETWNAAMRDTLIALQETRGHEAGSWDPKGDFAPIGGRIYMTSLAILTLEVYYRHLPLYRQHAASQ